MTEIDIECGHTKTNLYSHGVNKSWKMIAFSHLSSGNFNDNFMSEKLKSILVRINSIICATHHHLYVW